MSVKCPTCKAENKDGAKFCKECGASFASLIPCPSCSALIKPGKFCASCGHSFATAAPKADEIPAAEAPAAVPEAQAPAAPIQISFPDEAVPPAPPPPPPVAPVAPTPPAQPKVSPPPVAQPIPSQAVQPQAAPVSQAIAATAAATASTAAGAYARTSATAATSPADTALPKANSFKIAYVLVPVVILLALGGAYWWKSNHAQTATEPEPAAMPATVDTTPVAAPTPTLEPTAPVVPAPEPAPTPEPTPAPEPVAETKVVPVAPVQKQVPAKLPATNVKPAASAKGPVVEKPAEPRTQVQVLGATPSPSKAQPVPNAEAIKPTAAAKTLDEVFYQRITAECPQGFFPGMTCREKVRWQICDGKWSPDALPGQATCKSGGTK